MTRRAPEPPTMAGVLDADGCVSAICMDLRTGRSSINDLLWKEEK
jgi:hypothetical protein